MLMTRFAPSLLLVVSFSAATLGAGSAAAATLQTNVQYGGSGAVMNVFVPDAADEFPAIVVSLHYCNGAATNAASWLTPSLAEQHGFITIAPGLPSGDGDGCWDVGSSQSLTHDGGSHSRAIAQMVSFAISEYGADASRVYVLGASSGAMMTNVLLGSYPDVFAAGAVFAGVPFGCWTAGDGWTSECANGNTVKTAQQWGDQVRNAYPGYTGPRPRVQLFHGTADTTLHYKNLAEEIKQWTNVLALPDAPTTTEMNAPKSGWTRTSYENDSGTVMLEVAVGQGVGHDLTGQNLWAEIVRFFALDRDVPPGGTGGTGGQAGSSGAAGSAGVAGAGSGGVAGSGGTSGDGAGGAGTAGDAAGGTSGSGGAGSGAGGGVSAGTGGGGTGGSSGTTGSGGTSGAAGGTSGTGGSGATGGSSIPGGSGGTAGTSSAGNSGVAGTTSADDEPADDGGCSVGGPSGAPGGVLVTLLVFLGAVLRRKRRR
jgi:acetylxylan esterase